MSALSEHELMVVCDILAVEVDRHHRAGETQEGDELAAIRGKLRDEMDNPFKDPEWAAYANHVREEMLPKLAMSSFNVSLIPDGDSDVKFAVELGFSIMMDKPIVAVIHPGQVIPKKLAKVTDKVVEIDLTTSEGSEQAAKALADALIDMRLEE